MKRKLLFVIVVLAAVITVGTMSFGPSSAYQTRTGSNIDEVLSYQVPGGKMAAGMAEYFNALRVNPLTGTVSEAEYMSAVEASMNMQTKRVVNTYWNELGPDNVGGRTRAFLQDKDTPNLMFVGSVAGGLFISTTRGSSWKPVNDFQENLNISCIAQTSDGVIAYGTGEGGFVSLTGNAGVTPGFAGAGIFRSTDRGRTFTRVTTTSGFGNINSMAADRRPGHNVLYASTSGGVRKSTDNGLTWTLAKSGNSFEVKVATNGMVIAQSASTIVRSTDDGQNWDVITPPSVLMKRTSIAISPQDPNYIYLMVGGNDDKLNGVYRSTDAGNNWTQIIAKSTPYFDPLISGASAQAYYNNVITVNPKNKNHIIMGGVYLAEWIDGNNPRYIASLNDFGGANSAYVHADKHVLEWDMTTNPPTLICGNDGGLFFSSDNMRTFTMKNNGFNVTQFYAVAGDYMGNVTGGSQDNGTQYINKKGNTPKSAVEIKGGDGFKVDISVKDNSFVFAETYYGNVTRSRDFGKTQSCIWDRRISQTFGLTGADTANYCDLAKFSRNNTWAPFNTTFKLWEHPDYLNNESRFFLARHGQLWMALNPTDFQKEPQWYLIATAQGNQQVWDIEPTPDGNSVFFSNSNTIFRVDGLNNATYDKWSPISTIPPGITITNLNFSANGNSAISSICLDPNDDNTALITVGNYGGSAKVFRGNNMLGAATYTDISGNLPTMPVYDGVISLSNSNLMFVATDLGVYATDNGGSTWSAQTNPANNFPKVATLALRQYIFPSRSRGVIFAGTHGRGFYECTQYTTNINAVRNNKSMNMMSIYPNPAAEDVHVNVDVKNVESITIKVVDFTGRTVYTGVMGTVVQGINTIKIETRGLQAGTYIVTGTGASGNNYGTLKLIIRH